MAEELDASDLTRFQLDMLSVLADGDAAGKSIERTLEEQYDLSVPHGRVYSNLNTLVDMGLVEKHENDIDGRSHRYTLTERGTEVGRVFFGRGHHRFRRVPSHASPYE
jgi:PadR family transcriptional regulator PadR